MNKRKNIIILLLLLSAFSVFASQTATKVAVIDKDKILFTFYKESDDVRKVNETREKVTVELARLKEEIDLLGERKFEAESRGDDSEALKLDNEIIKKTEHYHAYYNAKKSQLDRMVKNVKFDSSFAIKLNQVIQYVATSQGYSFVFDKTTPALIWASPEVDITDLVIQRFQQN